MQMVCDATNTYRSSCSTMLHSLVKPITLRPCLVMRLVHSPPKSEAPKKRKQEAKRTMSHFELLYLAFSLMSQASLETVASKKYHLG
jgi:hypothetical protein